MHMRSSQQVADLRPAPRCSDPELTRGGARAVGAVTRGGWERTAHCAATFGDGCFRQWPQRCPHGKGTLPARVCVPGVGVGGPGLSATWRCFSTLHWKSETRAPFQGLGKHG